MGVRERVLGLGSRVAALRQRRRDQRVERLDQKKAPEREPSAARALRSPDAERDAEHAQAQIDERRQHTRVVVERADEPHETDVQEHVADERQPDEPRAARDDAPASDRRDAADALAARADDIKHVGEPDERDDDP